MTEMVHCVVCKNEIMAGANKCTHCSSYQDFRRYLNFSGTILGLLVALVSVSTFAIPIWEDVFWEPEIVPNSVLLDVDDAGMATISLSNDGNVPFALEGIATGSKTNALKFDLDAIEPSDRIVHPETVVMYKVPLEVDLDEFSTDVEDLVLIFQASLIRKEFCTIQVQVGATDGTYKDIDAVGKTRGFDEEEEAICPSKLMKLYTQTMGRIGKDENYVREICRVTAEHPMNPDEPKVGPACLKFQREIQEAG